MALPSTAADGVGHRAREAYSQRLESGRADALCPTTQVVKCEPAGVGPVFRVALTVATAPRPPRAKYDAHTDRLIARFDLFCPWLNNAVGLANHVHFVGFLLTSVTSGLLLNWL